MKKYLFPAILIFCLACLIMWPSLFDGGILNLLDYWFIPRQPLDFSLSIGQIVMHITEYAVGPVIASKFFYFGILVLSWFLWLFFARLIQDFTSFSSKWVEILGIVFFMMNPFAYERMMTQPTVYLGIILIGWWIYFLISKKIPSPRNHIIVWLCMGLALANFPHASYMVAIVYFLYLAFFVRSKKHFLYLFLGWCIFLLLNLNWLLAPFYGWKDVAGTIGDFGTTNLDAFLTRAIAPITITLTNILLYGFWWETSHFVLPWVLSPYWFIAWAFVWLIILSSFILWVRTQKIRKTTYFLLIIWIISLIFGLGIATPWTRPIMEWAYDYLPFFRGYREPQKWIGLLMIVEGIFFLGWTSYLLKKIQDIYVRGIMGFLILIMLIFWSPGMIYWFRGQLTTMHYPESFETLRQEMLQNIPKSKTLILPWHSYMACEWTSWRILHNSLDTFFLPLSMTRAHNIEMRSWLYSNPKDLQNAMIEQYLSGEWVIGFDSLKTFGYSHILVLKNCAEMNTFDWIDSGNPCDRSKEMNEFTLYDCSGKASDTRIKK